ncbi:hypothetical protein [Agarilytica rhodophyticola]|uniref:hypothetical protein n=1 Tax=Agarilytica rhodophyticola TaxID=1737490 RepID=UPI000B347147|nr:hypothetical protein [Agarilytica rhodophyticola]
MTEEDNLMTNQAVSDQTTDAQAIAKTTPAVDVNGNVWRINHLTGEAVAVAHMCEMSDEERLKLTNEIVQNIEEAKEMCRILDA